MEKIDVFSLGWPYEVILFALFLCVVVDAVGIVKSLRAGGEDIKEYADLCVKYLKLLFQLAAGVFFIYICITSGMEPASAAIHGVLGGALLLDAAVCLYIKLRYGKKIKKS